MEGAIVIHVILPTYRPDPRWLAMQLRSILNQSETSLKIWLCPDGPDETATLIAEGIGDKRIETLWFEQRAGVLANVQRGIEAALDASSSDDLFAFADQDDVWLHHKLAKGVAALPSELVAASTHDARVIDSEGVVLAPSLCAFESRHEYLDQLGLLIANTVSGMTMLMTREAVRRALPFPADIPDLLHDWWLALVVSGIGRIARIEEVLLDYRQHDRNVIGAKKADVFSAFTLRPNRRFLSEQYRLMALDAFESRKRIAMELHDRKSLAAPAESFFLNRKLSGLLRPWRGGAARYAVRCGIGMMLGHGE